MLTDEGQKRIDDALLASAMRKLLTSGGTYVQLEGHDFLLIDGAAMITAEEHAAIRKVLSDAGS